MTTGTVEPEPLDRAVRPRVVVSWALYDLANTIYAAIVVTAFLPPLMRDRYGGLTGFGLTTSAALLLSAFVSTGLGAHVDRTGRARAGLTFWTLACTASTVAMYFVAGAGAVPLLATYGASLFAYQAALTFYNALLPGVAPPHRRGFVSGLGTGLGYAGIPLSLLIGKAVMGGPMGLEGTFLVAAVLMTLGTIPLWLFVPDLPARAAPPGARPVPKLWTSIRWAASQPVLGLLLLANFVCADVANSLISYATTYFTDFAGRTMSQSIDLLIWISVTALAGGLVVGRYADRVRPTILYASACAALVVGLVVAGLAPLHAASRWTLVVTAGVGISTIWTVGRQLVIRVAPRERCGEALGLYGVTTKASIAGTTVFAVLRDSYGYAPAILTEAAVLAIGTVLVLAVDRRLPRGAA